MALQTFDFEKPIVELEERLEALRAEYAEKQREAEAELAAATAEAEAATAEAEAAQAAESAPGDAAADESGVEAPVDEEPPAEDQAEPVAETEGAGGSAEADEESAEAESEAGEPEGEPPDAEAEAPGDALERRLCELAEEYEPRIAELKRELEETRVRIYANLSPWQRIQIARHMARPRALDYIRLLLTDWTEIKGDRGFGDDRAVVCGLARFEGEPVAIIGQQKGKDTKENVARNFGMMHPEGYRKALRVMRLAERFHLPVLIFIDTPGAYPGIGAEERGQAEAIARNIMEMFDVRVPMIGIIIGEGASGGALGIGVVDHMLMLENSWYCVISPEGCASILWRDAAMAPSVAEALRLTAEDLLDLGIVDERVEEPLGGAHRDPAVAAGNLRRALATNLRRLMERNLDELLEERFQKYRNMGVCAE